MHNRFYYLCLLFLFVCNVQWNLQATQETKDISSTTQADLKLPTGDQINKFRGSSAIIDPISYEMGLQYADWLTTQVNIKHEIEICRLNDMIGELILYKYDSIGFFSPTTLRYMKIAFEIKQDLGDLTNKHILEIGGGYGGLCRLLSALGGFASYTFVNVPECNQLAKFYLEPFDIKNVQFIDSTSLEQIPCQAYDLVISDYTFSRFDCEEQNTYIRQVLAHIPMGYLSYDFSSFPQTQSLTDRIDTLIASLIQNGRKGKAQAESPSHHVSNIVLKWKTPSTHDLVAQPYSPPVLVPSTQEQKNNAITYHDLGRGLGTSLMTYLHAKWMSYKMGWPLLYVPFYNLWTNIPFVNSCFNDS